MKQPVPLLFLAAALAGTAPALAIAQQPPATGAALADPESGAPPYADLADLVLASPVVAVATVRSAARIKGAEAAAVSAGTARLYVTADLGALVRGTAGLPPRVGYLLDVPLDARGRVPKLRKQRVILFARAVSGTPDQLQLAAPDAQLAWTAPAEARVRRVVTEVVARDAPPAITGVGNAFFVAGALPGEGETQVFLQTADGRPVSLSVLRRPGEARRWAVALSEIVDEAAGPPRRDTFLWYRLACGLPRALPPAATQQLGEAEARAAEEDYRFVLQQLGPCVRERAAG
jgi:hypothetical protein